MKNKPNRSSVSVIIYWGVLLALLFMFFTNDFGLMDIHKTSFITAVGIDNPEKEVLVTAEVAVPQPSQGGENVKYTLVQGSGLTIADALNEINSKTGLYPKLNFCQLILVGENCKDNDLFRVLGCFYRKNYSELTASVAMCSGNASDMLAMKGAPSARTSEVIKNVLSDEINKSGNSISRNLKDIAETGYSKSEACFMPFVEANKPGTSEGGGNGDNVGGDDPESGGESGGSSSGSSGGESGSTGGQGGSGGTGGGSGQDVQAVFTTRKTAVFSRGKFTGILDEQQSFALAITENDIRAAVMPCDAEGVHYSLALSGAKGEIKLKVVNGVPQVTVSVNARARIQGVRDVVQPSKTMLDDVVKKELLKSANEELEKRFRSLVDMCVETDSDILRLKEQLYKYYNRYFDAFKDDLLQRMEVSFKIAVKSEDK